MICEICGKSRWDVQVTQTCVGVKLTTCVPCNRVIDDKLSELRRKCTEEFKNWFEEVRFKGE